MSRVIGLPQANKDGVMYRVICDNVCLINFYTIEYLKTFITEDCEFKAWQEYKAMPTTDNKGKALATFNRIINYKD